MTRVAERHRGILLCLGAYGMWGIMPVYWPLLRPADAIEILAHRIAWSLLILVALLAFAKKLGSFWRIGRNRLVALAGAALLIGLNWGVYIWAVNHGRVVETALGYFINPLVTVMLGVVVLRERLRRAQWAAIGLAAIAVALLTASYGRLPWISIVLASSFATYGLVKKRVGIGAIESLAIETMFLAGPAVLYLVVRTRNGSSAFAHVSRAEDARLALTGVLTTAPLLCFAGAANRVSFTTLGLMQYVAPTLQFLLGVLYFHEAMPAQRWLGFALVWSALAVFALDLAVTRRARA